MEKKNVLIVEDDINSIKMIEKLIFEVDDSVKCYKATDLNQAYMILHQYTIDVFIIDIILDTKVLGDVSGINLADEIRGIERYRFAPIIFITSLEDKKMYAFKKIHSFDYIEKPYLVDEVKKVIKQALYYKTQNERDRVLHFKKDGILISIDENDVVYMKTRGHMLYIISTKEEISIPYKTCSYMMSILNSSMFVQCNRNTIVNRRYVKNIDGVNRYLEVYRYCSKEKISIGKKYLKDILADMVIC